MPRSKNYDRGEVLERAMHTFWTKGYSATSINDLVEDTGINRFSLYSEFESKDRLYQEAFKKYLHSVMEDRMATLERSGAGIGCLRAFFDDYIVGVKNGLNGENEPVSCLSVLNAVERIGRERESSETMIRILKRMETAFATVLRRAIDKNEISEKSDIHEYAILLVGCTYGLDIMSKFLSASELRKYVSRVLGSLK